MLDQLILDPDARLISLESLVMTQAPLILNPTEPKRHVGAGSAYP